MIRMTTIPLKILKEKASFVKKFCLAGGFSQCRVRASLYSLRSEQETPLYSESYVTVLTVNTLPVNITELWLEERKHLFEAQN